MSIATSVIRWIVHRTRALFSALCVFELLFCKDCIDISN